MNAIKVYLDTCGFFAGTDEELLSPMSENSI